MRKIIVGLFQSADGVIQSPGAGAGARIVGVGDVPWSIAVLQERLTVAQPFRLRVRRGVWERTVDVPYSGGLQVPHLRRVEGRPDLLAAVMSPRAETSSPTIGINP